MFRDKKEKAKKDMQADNLYNLEMLESTDWHSTKFIDKFFEILFENPNQNFSLPQVIQEMKKRGLDIDAAKESIGYRNSLRNKIVGMKDVANLKKEHAEKKERYSRVLDRVDFYEDYLKKHKEEVYPQSEYNTLKQELEELKEWLLDNKWIANHEM